MKFDIQLMFGHINLCNLETRFIIIMCFQTMLPSNGFANYNPTNTLNQLTLCLMYKQLKI